MYIDCYIFQQNTPKTGVFTSESSANLMVGCSGPLTPPVTADDGMEDTTIMPHPHAQKVKHYHCKKRYNNIGQEKIRELDDKIS